MICPSTAALFIGDAKETETPGNVATFGRLRWYASAVTGASDPGRRIVFALAVPCTHDSRSFAARLVVAVSPRLRAGAPTTTRIGDMTVVAVLAIVA